MQKSYGNVLLKLCSFVVIVSLLLSSGAFSQWTLAAAKKPVVKSVTVTNVSAKKLTLTIGKTYTLKTKVKVSPNKSAYRNVKFVSKSPKIASVSSTGKIKALKAGTAKIQVTSKTNKKKSTTITVVVKPIMITGISLTKTTLTLSEDDDEYLLAVKIVPTNATSKKLKWESTNDSVVDVDEDGYVTPVAEGTATIKVKATDGSGKSASCKVTIIASEDDDDSDDDDSDDDDSDDDASDDDDSDDDNSDDGSDDEAA